jgi:hypothetical protein
MRTAQSIEEGKNRSSVKAPKGSAKSKRGSHPNSRKNLLAPWPKGFCPNPGGKPKRDWSADIARAVFEGNAEAVYEAMAKALLKGNAYAFKELADRAYGKIKDKVEHSGQIDIPLEQVQQRIKELLDRRKRAGTSGTVGSRAGAS